MRVLVVASHPDDETLGCGGTMARLANAGAEVYALAVACHDVNTGDQEEPRSCNRITEFADACALLGVKQSHILWQPHSRETLTHTQAYLVDAIETSSPLAIDVLEPDVIFMPVSNSFHQDHQVVHSAVFSACRFRGAGHFEPRCVLGFDGPEDSWRENPSRHSVFVDISATAQTKFDALAVYSKQLKTYPHPRSMESIDVIDRSNGVACGTERAERFTPYRLDLGALMGLY